MTEDVVKRFERKTLDFFQALTTCLVLLPFSVPPYPPYSGHCIDAAFPVTLAFRKETRKKGSNGKRVTLSRFYIVTQVKETAACEQSKSG